MYLFSPHDVREGLRRAAVGDISVTEKYREMVDDPRIRKRKIKARRFFEILAEIQFESGYPYILFEDTANRANPVAGRIAMSNLCSEILQVNEASEFEDDLSYRHLGTDISCNLGSMNIARAMDGGRAWRVGRNGGARVDGGVRDVVDQLGAFGPAAATTKATPSASVR